MFLELLLIFTVNISMFSSFFNSIFLTHGGAHAMSTIHFNFIFFQLGWVRDLYLQ
jgi:Na+/pantothenate symporter